MTGPTIINLEKADSVHSLANCEDVIRELLEEFIRLSGNPSEKAFHQSPRPYVVGIHASRRVSVRYTGTYMHHDTRRLELNPRHTVMQVTRVYHQEIDITFLKGVK